MVLSSNYVRRLLTVTVLLCAGLGPQITQAQSAEPDPQTVIMISLDGFRYDYLELHQPKFLRQLSEKGIRANLTPVYPSKTFPNHLALATGLTPAGHGIVDNRFYDKHRDAFYSLGDGYEDSTWISGIPIWNLAEQQGLKVASYFWPESDARINGMTPTYFYRYSHNADPRARIEQIKQWLQQPDSSRPRLILSYFHQIDSAGHQFGPEHPATAAAVHYIDGLLEDLFAFIASQETAISLIIVSDHGMRATPGELAIAETELPAPDNWTRVRSSTRMMYTRVTDKGQTSADLIAQIRQHPLLNKGFSLVMPEQRQTLEDYVDGRAGDVLLDAIPPYTFSKNKREAGGIFGTHGYGNDPQMQGIFIAYGPSIVAKPTPAELSVTDVYPLIAELLELELPAYISDPMHWHELFQTVE
ncbi:ectonucleotide pyrophosphatase/phosphodiesterase [Pseudidiomarina taiwanensis]|uniref:Alkaline phosphatase family protein n=1 Tax=Pseudidiomarina taiwanensis TaxID=337250 RepID=A0A432ZNB7_9GAMM|nr:ectonucleotide pyrophosphatase/phosphodiesterase [Pseudidiomarina taiwanensis]RUO79366.1 alkaline phosphatase family protein [Pseudidiomarina taiwanensis]